MTKLQTQQCISISMHCFNIFDLFKKSSCSLLKKTNYNFLQRTLLRRCLRTWIHKTLKCKKKKYIVIQELAILPAVLTIPSVSYPLFMLWKNNKTGFYFPHQFTIAKSLIVAEWTNFNYIAVIAIRSQANSQKIYIDIHQINVNRWLRACYQVFKPST